MQIHPPTSVQAGLFLIDDYVFTDRIGLSSLKQFINELVIKFEAPIFGLLLTTNQSRASNPSYFQDYLGPGIKVVSALMLPAVREAKRYRNWVTRFSVGFEKLLASMPVRKDIEIGIWYYVDCRSRIYEQPLELVYWILLFTGFNPLFMRRVVHLCDRIIECPSHPSASRIVVRKGRDYRDILLMSLVSIRFSAALSPYKIAQKIEEVLGRNEYGSADSLRKTIATILLDAESCCLVTPKGVAATYTITPFGELLLDALLSNNLRRYIVRSKIATFIEHIMSISGLE